MLVQSCQKDKKPGWKWGKSGTCYTGPGAKAKARRQGAAIQIRRQQNSRDGVIRIGVYQGNAPSYLHASD